MKYKTEFFEECLTNLNGYVNIFHKTKNLIPIGGLWVTYNSLALGEWELREDIIATKKWYYKAGRSHYLYLKLYQGKFSKWQWPEYEIPSFVATLHRGLVPMLLSDDYTSLNQFMVEIERLPYERYSVKADIAISYATKYLLIGDKTKALKYMDENYLKAKVFTKGLGCVVAGILKNDITMINEGIALEIKNHKREYIKEHHFYHISEEATAWAKLAQHFDFQVDINSNFIHKELLKVHNNIPYEDIRELYKILNIEPI